MKKSSLLIFTAAFVLGSFSLSSCATYSRLRTAEEEKEEVKEEASADAENLEKIANVKSTSADVSETKPFKPRAQDTDFIIPDLTKTLPSESQTRRTVNAQPAGDDRIVIATPGPNGTETDVKKSEEAATKIEPER